MEFMRYNDYENDPLSTIENCSPSANSAATISSRLDINPKSDPDCSFPNPPFRWPFGAIDAKLASRHSFPSLNFAAVTGPTHDQHPPFSWNQPLPIDAGKPNF